MAQKSRASLAAPRKKLGSAIQHLIGADMMPLSLDSLGTELDATNGGFLN